VAVGPGEFEYRFRLPAATTWVRAELFEPDLAAERGVVCDDAFGSETTYCRNLLLVLAMTSALYLRADAPVPAPAPGVVRGTARIPALDRGCRRRPFTASVRGRSIRRVRFFVDGRRLPGVRRRAGRFYVRVDPRALRPGRHRLRSRVSFVSASQTRGRTIRTAFTVCARRADRRAAPRFTG